MEKDKKRAELHLHTKSSDDISVIDVLEVFQKADELGLKAVAFTNAGNVLDFPLISRYSRRNKTGLKVIYGAELFYAADDENGGAKITLLAKNNKGIKELYKVISSQQNDGACDLSVLKQNRKNLLVGSAGCDGELFKAIASNKSHELIARLAVFYDYFEIYPTTNEKDRAVYKKIYKLGQKLGVPVVAVGNCHYTEKEDELCRRVAQNVTREVDDNKNLYIHTPDEMLEEFSYLGASAAKKAVINNADIIVDSISRVSIFENDMQLPEIENAYEKVREAVYKRAGEIYGNALPQEISERLEKELENINGFGFSTQYLIAKQMVEYANSLGYPVSSRGMVGSTLLAFLLGITDINPLLPHYYCPKCHYVHFENDAASGVDLADKTCPVCVERLLTDGHNIPFETFMGIKGDKVPDIDISFPFEIWENMFEFLKGMFGEDRVMRATVINTLHEMVIEGYIQIYEADASCRLTQKQREHITGKLCGVKRSGKTGLHPGGVLVLPKDAEFEDFTPVRGIEQNSSISRASHFDFHYLHDDILKIDVLTHKTLDMLKQLEASTGVKLKDIKLNDAKVYHLFRTGNTLGISEFDRDFMRGLLLKTKAKCFNDLIKISGLAHGTSVWNNNAEHLIGKDVLLSQIPALRDDIMQDLINIGVDRATAFRYGEAVRKGLLAKGKLSDEALKEFKEITKPLGGWYFDFCSKVCYMFPKAHAVACVLNSVRLAWFKLYYPTEFYKAYFNCYDSEELTTNEKTLLEKVKQECLDKGIEL